MWLLGSSDYSARLAAEKGLPYVFAHHFSGEGTGVALDLYRSSYRPSPEHPEPRTFLTVNAVVAETEEEARRRALPNVQQMIALRTGAPLHPQRLVEEAEAVEMTPEQRSVGTAMARRWVVGSPEQARRQLAELAETYGVDEVMVHPVAGAATGHRRTHLDRRARRRCACWRRRSVPLLQARRPRAGSRRPRAGRGRRRRVSPSARRARRR